MIRQRVISLVAVGLGLSVARAEVYTPQSALQSTPSVSK